MLRCSKMAESLLTGELCLLQRPGELALHLSVLVLSTEMTKERWLCWEGACCQVEFSSSHPHSGKALNSQLWGFALSFVILNSSLSPCLLATWQDPPSMASPCGWNQLEFWRVTLFYMFFLSLSWDFIKRFIYF